MVRKSNIHFIYVLSAAMLWGTAGIFVRTVQNDIKEMQLVLCRAVFSALFFGAVIFFRDKSLFKIRLRHLWIFISAGLFSIVLFNYSYYTAMSLTSLSVAAVLLYTAPFFVVIMSLILFKERLTLNKIVACISAFIGCCLVTGIFDSSHKVGGKAVFYGLLTGFGYALYTIFSELLLKRGYKTLTITFYVFLFAALSAAGYTLGLDSCGECGSHLTSAPKMRFDMNTGSFTCWDCGTGYGTGGATYNVLRMCAGRTYEPEFITADGRKRALRLLREYFAYKTDSRCTGLSEYIRLL